MAGSDYPHQLSGISIQAPYVLADEGAQTYFLYARNDPELSGEAGSGVMAYRSKNLRDWSEPAKVYAVPDNGWADPTAGASNPEVHRHGDQYLLIVTLQNPDAVIAEAEQAPGPGGYDGDAIWQNQTARASVLATADAPDGPFTDLDTEAPVTDPSLMTIDGTFHSDPDGTPWMVFAQEWLQQPDAPMGAVRLSSDLSAAADEPIRLFKAKTAPWFDDPDTGAPPDGTLVNDLQGPPYATSAPQVYRTPNRSLVMLWSSYRRHFTEYVQTQAISRTGNIAGPWEQRDPIVSGNRGHGMVFRAFDGRFLLIAHDNHDDPSKSRAQLFDVDVTDDGIKVLDRRDPQR